jgi:DNA-binding NarL/FixJ family response regulator
LNSPISVLVADDHAMLQTMLKSRLEAEPDIRVVAVVGRADEAVASSLQFKPQVVLMDIDMPGMSSFDAARLIRRGNPDVRVVFLSAYVQDRQIEQALEAGASGYVAKSQPEESLIAAVRSVAAGEAYFSPEVQARIVVGYKGPHLAHAAVVRTSNLTPRELEILRHLAEGMSKKEIARALQISVNTVNRHASSLMSKLNIHDRVELTRFAIREGLAEL